MVHELFEDDDSGRTALHFGQLEVPGWVEGVVIPRSGSLHDLVVYVYCHEMKVGSHVMAHVYPARVLVPGMLKHGSGYLLNTALAAWSYDVF